MSYGLLFRHRWYIPFSHAATSTKGLRLGGLLLLLLVALCAGAFAEDVIRATHPNVDPIRWINGWMLPLGMLYVIASGYQGAPGLRPYLPLPVSRKTLVRFGLGHALLHPLNVGIFAFGIALWGRTIVSAHSWAASAVYGAGLLFGLGTVTHLARLFTQVLAKRPLRVALLLAGGGLLVVIGIQSGLIPLFDVSERLFSGLLELRALPILLLAGSYAGSLALHRRQLWRRLYLDDAHLSTSAVDESATSTADSVGTGTEHTDAVQPGAMSQWVDRHLPVGGRGTVGALVAMEWRLISRNRQPRRLAVVLVLPAFVALLAVVTAVTGTPLPYDWTVLFIWGVAVGGWVLDYGSKVLSWEGRQLDGVLTRAVRPEDLAQAKLITLVGGTLFLWVLPLPVILLAGTSAIGLHAAFLVYVLGLGVPVILVAALFNGRPVDLNDQSLFTASEFGLGRNSASVLLIGPPIGLFVWGDTLLTFAGGLAALGVLSALFVPLWIRLLHRAWDRRHPKILEEFREAEG